MSTSDTVGDLSFTDLAIQAHPNGFYRALREGDPIHYDECLGMYLVSRYKDVDIVLRDPLTFSQERGYYKQWAHGYLDELKSILERDGGGFIPDVVNIDPPRHRRARRLTEQAFSRRRIKLLEPEFEALVGEMIDKLADKGEADGLTDIALPMSISFIIKKLKVPDLDFETIRRWGNAYNAQYSLMQTREQFLENARKICELQNYVIALVQQTPSPARRGYALRRHRRPHRRREPGAQFPRAGGDRTGHVDRGPRFYFHGFDEYAVQGGNRPGNSRAILRIGG